MIHSNQLHHYTQLFFQDYLVKQRSLSPNTILSYRDCMKLFLRFASNYTKVSLIRLDFSNMTPDLVLSFLNDLEETRKNSPLTRNSRLAFLHCFFKQAAMTYPSYAEPCQRICSIPFKKTGSRSLNYLEREELHALFDSIDISTFVGKRDYALMLFMYNTGCRVQEIADMTIGSLQLTRPYQVRIIGKGRKERICPLWPETAKQILQLLESSPLPSASQDCVFKNQQSKKLTRFGVTHIIQKYQSSAMSRIPSLKNKRVTPHVLRHTTAVHMLESGVDLNLIRSWLGHVSLTTTNCYAEVNLATKRKALELCHAPEKKAKKRKMRNTYPIGNRTRI